MKAPFSKLGLACVLLMAPAAWAESKEPPVPVRTVAPEYPSEMRHAAINGVVTVTITIDEHGTVSSAQVLKSSDPAFERAAVAAVEKWKFKPAKVDGKPVPIKVNVPISFVLS